MKKIILAMVSLCYATCFVYAQNVKLTKSFIVTIQNPIDVSREATLVNLSLRQIKTVAADFNEQACMVMDGKTEIPSQVNKHDQDFQGIVFVLDKLGKKESRKLTIRYSPTGVYHHNYIKRTQAELSHKTGGEFVNREYVGGTFKNVDSLRVPVEHKDHSWFIRYEGPGWESDKVGYRLYLDQRDANDVFGKRTSDMVLQNVGLDGFDSYHELQPWGMDVMKVGKSLGLGTPAIFQNGHAIRIDKTDSVKCRITENGVVYSSILTNYWGWQTEKAKVNVSSRLTIHAGTRLTHQFISLDKVADANLCTGIVKDKNATLKTSPGDAQHFGYIATYGKQSLDDDNLGLAVFFKNSDMVSFTEDEFSHVVTFKPAMQNLDYYFLAAWQQEAGGIKTEQEFDVLLRDLSYSLNNPVMVKVTAK